MGLRDGKSTEGQSDRQDAARVIRDGARGWQEELRDGESGQTTVIMTLFLATFLMGFIAIGIDVQSLFAARRQVQAAADAAAVAAAEEYPDPNGEQTAASAVAKLNGFDDTATINPAYVHVVGTPQSGTYSGSSSFIEVQVSKAIPTFFSALVTRKSTVTVSARAVAAKGQTSPSCICLEGTTGTDLNMSNGTSLNLTGCGVMVNSTSSNAVTMAGSSKITSLSLGIASSSWTASANVGNAASISPSTKVITGVTTSCAPPMPIPPAFNAAQCTADPLTHYGNGGSSYNVGPGGDYTTTQSGGVACYNSLIVGSNSDTVNLNNGIYVINGGTLEFQNGHANTTNTGGNSVLFYLTNGAKMVIDQGANPNLTASTTGPYAGIVVYQDPANSSAMTMSGGSNTSFNGSILAPSSDITLSNGSGTNLSADMVAKTLTMTGSGDLAGTDVTVNGTPTTNFGTLNTTTAKLTE